ncbi:unnamed protein product, partial [Brachionus calyciflorus]
VMMSSERIIFLSLIFIVGVLSVMSEDVLSEVQNEHKDQEDLSLFSKKLRDLYILSQLRQIQTLRNNLAKILTNEELAELEDDNSELNDQRDKKSVMLPRIGRSPVVFPRIGAEKKRAVFQPRVGRNYDLYESSEENEPYVEKRVAFKPRIG